MQRLSVTNNTTDFSSFVTRIPCDTDVVFTPFQVAANANQVAVLLKEQGKNAVVFGGDGTVGPAFKVPGSYVSNFAPDIASVPGRQAILNAWKRDNPERTVDVVRAAGLRRGADDPVRGQACLRGQDLDPAHQHPAEDEGRARSRTGSSAGRSGSRRRRTIR